MKRLITVLALLLASCNTVHHVANVIRPPWAWNNSGGKWHRVRSGMELWLTANPEAFQAGLCDKFRVTNVEVSTTRWIGSGELQRPDCNWWIERDVREAIQVAGLAPNELLDPRMGGESLKVWVVDGDYHNYILCGKDYHSATHCTDGSGIIVARAGMRENLEAAFKDLLVARFLGER